MRDKLTVTVMSNSILVTEGIRSLPSFPETSFKLIDILNESEPSISEILEVIKYDSSVTSQVLRISNSAYFGLVDPVETLHDALMTIGTTRLLQIVIAMQTGDIFKDFDSVYRKAYNCTTDVVWQSSVRLGVCASMVANYTENYDRGVLFTAGLLHNVGKSVMAKSYEGQYAPVNKLVVSEGLSYSQAEKVVFGMNYQDVGEILALQCGLSKEVISCIRNYNSLDGLKQPTVMQKLMFISFLISDFGDEDACWILHSHLLNEFLIDIKAVNKIQSSLNIEMNKIMLMLRS
jgi:HD-like signal output (HDOD) protein